jgi:hypothetical protein
MRTALASGLLVLSVGAPPLAAPAPALAAPAPATGRAAAVASALATVERTVTATRYQHQAKVDTRKGIYLWDCSIMAAWVLARTAPEARRALAAAKPLARDFYRAIDRAPDTHPVRGWQRLTDPASVLPGDVFAWLKPALFKDRPNTGHVGFVVGRPWRHPKHPGVWLMRIADATTELHGADSRPAGGEGGFGTATIAFAVDGRGDAVAYGWYGEDQDPQTFVSTRIVFGRVFR